MRVLVTGAKGQLGYDVVNALVAREIEFVAVDRDEMDITSYTEVESVLVKENVDAVIHCAAYTAVDSAEDNLELCRKVNIEGTWNIAKICKTLGMKMVYISTDYVFNGLNEEPWDTDSPRHPLNAYGQSKYEGELAVEELLEKYFIVRISWVFGINGKNFVDTMLKLGETRGEVQVVKDQFGSPTYTADLASLLVDMVLSDKYGIYHATNEGICSWYEFACEIFKLSGLENIKVIPVESDQFLTKAKRPLNSRMSKIQLEENGFRRLPQWKDALKRYLEYKNVL